MIVVPVRPSLRLRLRALVRDRSGLALMEFAFTLPIVLAMGGWGIELSFFALTNLRISQYALNLADNASRLGVDTGTNVVQLREADINDVLQGTRLESAIVDLTSNGRVTLSSLENIQQPAYDTTRKQRIHWQRCIGVLGSLGYDTPYTTSPTAGSTNTLADAGLDATAGINANGRTLNALPDTGVMIVEVSYRYRPVFGTMFVSPKIIHYSQSFMVRDNRDFTRIYNPTPAVPAADISTCDKHAV